MANAISCGEAFVLQDAPGVTIFGFKRVPENSNYFRHSTGGKLPLEIIGEI